MTRCPDGKVIIGGAFTNVNGLYRNRIARLNIDGSVDTSFECNPGPNGFVSNILVQPDGRLLVGGSFTQWSTRSRRFVVRLNENGRSDYPYDTSWNDVVANGMALQPDGKLLIGGHPYMINTDVPIIRFNTNGTRDLTFHTDVEFNIKAVALDSDGSHDDGFDGVDGPNGWVSDIALQPDGKVLIVGSFTAVNGIPRNGIGRLHGDPRLDARSVPAGVETSWPAVYTNFILQTAESVPSANWITVTNSPVIISNMFVLTNTITSGHQFFRLAKP